MIMYTGLLYRATLYMTLYSCPQFVLQCRSMRHALGCNAS